MRVDQIAIWLNLPTDLLWAAGTKFEQKLFPIILLYCAPITFYWSVDVSLVIIDEKMLCSGLTLHVDRERKWVGAYDHLYAKFCSKNLDIKAVTLYSAHVSYNYISRVKNALSITPFVLWNDRSISLELIQA